MNLHEATQYGANGVTILAGANLDFGQPTEFPCDDCGAMVDLTSIITVSIQNQDGTMSEEQMTEADARALLATVGVPPPPVMCERHDDFSFEAITAHESACRFHEISLDFGRSQLQYPPVG